MMGGSVIASGATPTPLLGYGTHTLALTVSDGKGGSDSDEVRIAVADTQPPALTLLGANPLVVNDGESYVEYGATAIDGCQGDLTGVRRIWFCRHFLYTAKNGLVYLIFTSDTTFPSDLSKHDLSLTSLAPCRPAGATPTPPLRRLHMSPATEDRTFLTEQGVSLDIAIHGPGPNVCDEWDHFC